MYPFQPNDAFGNQFLNPPIQNNPQFNPYQQNQGYVPPIPNQPLQPRPSEAPKKIDARTLPNPTKSKQIFKKVIFNTNSLTSPPPCHSKYIVQDGKNASPRFIRSTLNVIPTKQDIINKTGLPFSLVVQPLADVGYEEQDIPIIDMGPEGPLRCRRCGSYINPHIQFTDNGHLYICCLCRTTNQIPDEYFSPIEMNGERRDINERIELWRGTVDFVAPKEMQLSEPYFKTFLFVIDVSQNSSRTHLINGIINSIKQILELNFSEDHTTKFGFITFDKHTHFWRIKPHIEMLSLPDETLVFKPLPHDYILSDYPSNKETINSLLDIILEQFSENNVLDSCYSSTLNAAILSLPPQGGRIISFLSSLPTKGHGHLAHRDDPSAYGRDKEKALYKLSMASKYYDTLAKECAKRSAVVDLFLCATSYLDVNTLSILPEKTCGEIHYYDNFNLYTHEERLFYELNRTLTRRSGSAAICKVRTSEGLSVAKYYGHFTEGEGDIECPGIDSDKTFTVDLKYDGTLDEKGLAIVQWAMLYTNEQGLKLVRVHTLALKISSIVANVFKSADIDVVLYILARKSIAKFGQLNLNEIRKELTSNIIAPLTYYRKHCAKNSPPGQLILPDSLKFLAVYTLGLLKHILFSNPRPLSQDHISIIDSRMYYKTLFFTMSPEYIAPFVYPRLYPIHKILDLMNSEQHNDSDDGSDSEEIVRPIPGDADFYGSCWLPPISRLSVDDLEAGGIYILDNHESIYLAFHPPVNLNIANRIVDENGRLYYNQEDEFNIRVNNIIAGIRYRRAFHQVIITQEIQNNSAEAARFRDFLIEDGNDDFRNKEQINMLNKLSYTGYLCHVHQCIQDNL